MRCFKRGRLGQVRAPASLPPAPSDGSRAAALYRFIWRVTGRDQLWLCGLTLVLVPLAMVPLELQRRMTDEAIGRQEVPLLLALGLLYLLTMLVQGGLKALLNLRRGRVVELVALELRRLVQVASLADTARSADDRGSLVSMAAAEAEDVAGFVGESLSIPLLHGGTIVVILAYLVWVQPLIAGLAVLIYLPLVIVVPWRQRLINRLGRLHVRLVRALGDVIVREHAGTPSVAGRYPLLAERAFLTRIATYRIKYFLTFLGNFLDASGPLGVLVVGGWLVIQGQATLGTLVVFITGFQKVGDPLDQLLTYYRTAQIARVKYELLTETVGAHMEAAVATRARAPASEAHIPAVGAPGAATGSDDLAGTRSAPRGDAGGPPWPSPRRS
jgi:ABC-type bacteriocin/lantibiotic exporter with double-glycine peptidase domain